MTDSGFDSDSDFPSEEQPTLPPGTQPGDDATIAPQPHGQESDSKSGLIGEPEADDYELLEELGRGGMGVVYKARHKKLDRIVALKMILGGQFASEEAVRRFELEAESAAKLDHPGIVPIYEIGQTDGNHFYSMKLVEGRSLADSLDDYQLDPRKTARLMIEIARAVHHAHERGVLHRDLKPANILLDADGNAAITDLGLAKQLGDDSGLTQTGLVMGSPGFMSPEQAAGKSDATTAVDVYALGAILYWLLAGRAPFQGDTQLEVILQTIDQRPQSVRAYQPDADRDLNLIAQKALEKSPSNRYASAAAFADDLQAWLDGDVLSVKPPSALDLARIWIRKNFRTVAMASSSGVFCGLVIGMIVLMIAAYNQIQFIQQFNTQLGETSRPWVIRYFGWVAYVPAWLLFALPTTIVWLNVVFGIAAIRLIKPKSREVGLVAATAAALLAGIVAYTVSLGWNPIRESAIFRGANDIELISNAMWMENPTEQELSRRALMQRYPGLANIDREDRGELIYQKIINDQALGVPQGMWQGIWTTLCLCVLPLFFVIALSGLIWDRGERGWAYFGKSIETGIYSGLFFLVMTKFVTDAVGMSPGIGLQILSMIGIGTAIWFAIRDLDWPWRLVGFALANVCIIANFYESSMIHNATQVASRAESDAKLGKSTRYFVQRIKQKDDPWDRFQLGVIAAYLGDQPQYAQQCQALESNFQNIYRPNVAERLVKVCLLKPDLHGLTPAQMKRIHELAELVSEYRSADGLEYRYFARALSEMRLGNLAGTLDWSGKCQQAIADRKTAGRAYLVASCLAVEALAHPPSSTEAAACLQQAEASLAGKTEPQKGNFLDKLIYRTLSEEAAAAN